MFLWNHDSTKRIYKRKITKKLLENLKNQEKEKNNDGTNNVTRPGFVKNKTLHDDELFNLFLSWKQIDENLVRKNKNRIFVHQYILFIYRLQHLIFVWHLNKNQR